MLTRVEKHIKGDNMLFDLCFKSKNLYNKANYIVRQEFIQTSKEKENGLRERVNWIRYNELYRLLKDSDEYKALPAQSSQTILRNLDKNWISFFKTIKKWSKNKSLYNGMPKLPKYKNKDGLKEVIYPGQNISIKNGYIKIPKSEYKIKTTVNKKQLKELRLIPYGNKIKIEIVYEKELNCKESKKSNVKFGIDLGINNLCSITSNQKDIPTYLINGKIIKSINQFYNKKLANEKSKLKLINNQNHSKKISKLSIKKNLKIEDQIHKISRKIANLCIKYNVDEIIIGYNKEWKQNTNIGKVNNQKFVQIPYLKLIYMITYKVEEFGIKTTLTEESYTSKVDHLVLEPLKKQEMYKGNRIKRGLFNSSSNRLINADVNGSLGILRKVIGDDFIQPIEGLVFNPIKLNIF